MATQIAPQFEVDCALMAGRAYQENRDDINKFPISEGWTEFYHVPSDTYPTSSGFEAVSFVRGTAGLNQQIVISFAGSNPVLCST
jgi:hypothetical protein